MLVVVDAMIGQDAVKTAQAFKVGVGFDGVVLTKLDGDTRGGAALSIAALTGKPIMFASTGEKLGDFDLFYPERMASRILGMGDVATLAEQAKKALDGESSAKMEEKFIKGEDFTLEDFLEQLEAMSKMGSMGKLLSMLPGAGAMKKQIENFEGIWEAANKKNWPYLLYNPDPQAPPPQRQPGPQASSGIHRPSIKGKVL